MNPFLLELNIKKVIIKLSESKNKRIPPRIPEGESILDQPELSMEELNEGFKIRIREYKHFVKFILNDLQVKDYAKILEIGPGPGWITIIMAKKNPTLHITGLEISEDMIRVANKNVEDEGVRDKIQFICGDAKNMYQFEDKSFDVIISHDSLHHWDNPKSVFHEITRILKPNGIFCIGDGRRDISLGAKIIFNVMKLFIPKQMSYYWKTSIQAGYTPDEITEILNDTKLKEKYEIKADLFDLLITNKIA
jgi:ubiquinone/menaquinone biosynthesis C-methylase UbiE